MKTKIALAALAATIASLDASAALKATKIGEKARSLPKWTYTDPVGGTNVSVYAAVQISGVTWVGGDSYYAVDDNDRCLYKLKIATNSSGAITSTAVESRVVVEGAHDMEGCAYDAAAGTVWVSDETGPTIREIDPETGKALRSVAIPAIMKQCYGNFSLEALTISGDGLTMWTSNEEALTVDGEKSTKTEGSVVRLTRFSRRSVYDNWTLAGQWAYLTDPIKMTLVSNSRSGVSGLVALPDGTLLVLERAYGEEGWIADDFYNGVYSVDFSNATEISGVASLRDATYTKVVKTAVFPRTKISMVNYEGICLGPRLDDGSCVLMLVGDGGGGASQYNMTLKLTGIDVATWKFDAPEGGVPSFVGYPYRFVDGSTVVVSLAGASLDSVYTNNAYVCTNVSWRADGGTPSEGTGASASFKVVGDGVFHWDLSYSTSSTPIVANDSFEAYGVGTEAGEISGWTGDGMVVAKDYAAPVPAGYPMGREPHTRVLEVDDEVVRTYPAASGDMQTIDMMVCVRRSPEETFDDAYAASAGAGDQAAVVADKNGYLHLLHENAGGERVWTRISDAAYANGDWVRMSFTFDYASNPAGNAFVAVRVNGSLCPTDAGVRSPANPLPRGPWYYAANNSVRAAAKKGAVSSIVFLGSPGIDDLILTTPEWTVEDGGAALATARGVPYSWLDAQGLARNADDTVKTPGGSGYGVYENYVTGVDPWSDEKLEVKGVEVADGRIRVEFNGRRADPDDAYYLDMADAPDGFASSTPLTDGEFEETASGTAFTARLPDKLAHGFFRVRAVLSKVKSKVKSKMQL